MQAFHSVQYVLEHEDSMKVEARSTYDPYEAVERCFITISTGGPQSQVVFSGDRGSLERLLAEMSYRLDDS